MSCSHNLSTDQPFLLSLLEYLLSRLMFPSILSRQNFFAGFFFSSYLYPCQKSPSQKITIFFLLFTKSGFPYILGYISNLCRVSDSIVFIFRSILVLVPLMRDITQDLFSLEKMSVIFHGCLFTIKESQKASLVRHWQ